MQHKQLYFHQIELPDESPFLTVAVLFEFKSQLFWTIFVQRGSKTELSGIPE